jgi:hypothetical protein
MSGVEPGPNGTMSLMGAEGHGACAEAAAAAKKSAAPAKRVLSRMTIILLQ